MTTKTSNIQELAIKEIEKNIELYNSESDELDELLGLSEEETKNNAIREIVKWTAILDNPEAYMKNLEKMFRGTSTVNFDGTPKFE